AQLLVFNFSNDNPSRSYMEWYGNWYLIYRSADCLTRMVELAQLNNAKFSVEKEPTGANLYLQIEKL
ncbi:MAG: class I SAM-dependent methyltransferase, partial [Planctomycetota bacterium]